LRTPPSGLRDYSSSGDVCLRRGGLFAHGAAGTEGVDDQCQQRTTGLGRIVAAGGILAVHSKDGVFVAVERDRLAMLLQMGAGRPKPFRRQSSPATAGTKSRPMDVAAGHDKGMAGASLVRQTAIAASYTAR
jgi:hypothetical protein